MVKLPWMRRALTMTLMTRMTSIKPSMMIVTEQCHAFSLNEIVKKCSGQLFDEDLKFLPRRYGTASS